MRWVIWVRWSAGPAQSSGGASWPLLTKARIGPVVGDGDGYADGVLDGAAGDGDLAEVEGAAGDDLSALGDVEVGQQGVAAAVFDDADGVVVEPGFDRWGCRRCWG